MNSDHPVPAAAAYDEIIEKAVDVRQLHDALRRFYRTDRSCINCDHYNGALEECRLAGARPPIRIAVVGCKAWCENIPF